MRQSPYPRPADYLLQRMAWPPGTAGPERPQQASAPEHRQQPPPGHARYRMTKTTERITAAIQSQPGRPIRTSRCHRVGRRRRGPSSTVSGKRVARRRGHGRGHGSTRRMMFFRSGAGRRSDAHAYRNSNKPSSRHRPESPRTDRRRMQRSAVAELARPPAARAQECRACVSRAVHHDARFTAFGACGGPRAPGRAARSDWLTYLDLPPNRS